ncbi:winged helix-turn-helix domain-containing protein [Maritalea sp.]|jgi:DNA-binding response OmpR family regulator|uniref:winged helix-turn-helix domain-containing protein n=1 Tax=Maritalea sp. TaxID=2003361 RepID=UPI0039E241B5
MMDIAMPTDNCPCCGGEIIDQTQVLIDEDTGILVRNGYFVSLPIREFELFQVLWRAKGRVQSKEAILDGVYWQSKDCEQPEIRIVDVFVCKIRPKIKPLGIVIETCWARGYRIVEKELETNA